jgi:PAS domain S-box-containing protein
VFFSWQHTRSDGSLFDAEVSLNQLKIGDQILIQAIVRDVTERKLAQEEVQKLATVVRHSSELVNLATLDGMMIFLNEAGGKMLGIDPDEVEQVNIMQVIPEHLKQLVETELLPTLKDSRTWEGELQYRNLKTGQLTDVHAITFTVQDPLTSEPLYLANVSHDITDRKQAEQALVASEAKYKSLFDNSIHGIGLSKGNRVISANKAILDILGYDCLEEFTKIPILDHVAPESREMIRERMKQREKGEPMTPTFEYKIIRKDGKIRDLEASSGEILIEGEKYTLSTFRDITDRKRAREDLDRLTAILENTSDLVSTATPDHQLTYFNRAGRKLVGWQDDDSLEGKKISDVHPKWAIDLITTEGIPAAIRDGIWKGETALLNPDGKDIPVSQVIMSHKSPNGHLEYLSTIIRDITDRKRAEKKLLDYQDQLRSLASELSLAEERQRRQIATDLHDHISQALALSLLTLQSFRQSAGSTNLHKLDEVCNTINEMIDHVRTLTFDLSPPTLYKFGLERAIAELADDQLRRRHGIACEFFDDQADKPLEDDVRVLLFQSARELIINIIKHAQAHKVRIALQSQGPNIQVCVSDDGIGFDVDKVRSAAGKRGGFGLFNIQERLDYIGGDFKIESRPGKGSRFTLTAPLKTKAIQS